MIDRDVLIARVVNVVVPEAGAADVMLWPGYGFVCPSLVTTNGNAWTLLSALRVWDRPGRDVCQRWVPVHPDAPTHGATVESVVRALARIAGQAQPSGDAIATCVRSCALDGATLLGAAGILASDARGAMLRAGG